MLEAKREATYAVVRVRDDGMGIARNMLDAIFDLFVQSNRTLERAQGGIGVGLTLAKSLVELHGGTLTAHSDGEGKGSIFEVRLAISERRREADAVKPIAKVVKGSRVVIVEDNVDAREMLCHLLARAGLECRSVGDGSDAVALIDSFQPHAAIIDVGLPGIDGFEVARRVRKNPKNAEMILVAVTGYGQQADKDLALEAGFNFHMVKPIKLDQLSEILGQFDGKPRTASRDPS
jgi:two-component system CheB/CheR fusion protein